MDRLQQLACHVSKEANDQAEEVMNLMTQAGQQQKDHVIFSTPHAMHPLVMQTLTSKGYRVQLVPPVTSVHNFGFTATLQQPGSHYKIYV